MFLPFRFKNLPFSIHLALVATLVVGVVGGLVLAVQVENISKSSEQKKITQQKKNQKKPAEQKKVVKQKDLNKKQSAKKKENKNQQNSGKIKQNLVSQGLLAKKKNKKQQTKQKRPNIVLIQTDDQTYESLSKMPYVNSRSDWIRFENYITGHPLCCPSRASLLTGQYSHHTGVEDLISGWKMNANQTTGTWLHNKGYATAFIGKYLNDYKPGKSPPGWDFWAGTNDGAYFNYSLIVNGKKQKYGNKPRDYSSDVYTAMVNNFVKKSNKPFFVQLNLKTPHMPYTPAPRYKGQFQGTAITHPPSFYETDVSDKPQYIKNQALQDPNYWAEMRRQQYRMNLSADDAVRKVFGMLENTGKLSNTVVIYTSDNGFQNGEHRVGPKRFPYEGSIKVPLLIRYPGQSGKTIPSLASNIDIAPTITHIAGRKPGAPVDGRSLIPLITGTHAQIRDNVLLRNKYNPSDPNDNAQVPPSYWGLRTSRYKYIEYVTGEKELYDLQTDPFELQNLANQPEYASLSSSLAQQMRIEIARPPIYL